MQGVFQWCRVGRTAGQRDTQSPGKGVSSPKYRASGAAATCKIGCCTATHHRRGFLGYLFPGLLPPSSPGELPEGYHHLEHNATRRAATCKRGRHTSRLMGGSVYNPVSSPDLKSSPRGAATAMDVGRLMNGEEALGLRCITGLYFSASTCVKRGQEQRQKLKK